MGSAAVLRYVRDTIVNAEAHHVAAEFVAIDKKPLDVVISRPLPRHAADVGKLATEEVAMNTRSEQLVDI